MQEPWVQSLDQEDPLEKEMASHSSILAWEIPGTEEPGYSPRGHKELDTTERLSTPAIIRCSWISEWLTDCGISTPQHTTDTHSHPNDGENRAEWKEVTPKGTYCVYNLYNMYIIYMSWLKWPRTDQWWPAVGDKREVGVAIKWPDEESSWWHQCSVILLYLYQHLGRYIMRLLPVENNFKMPNPRPSAIKQHTRKGVGTQDISFLSFKRHLYTWNWKTTAIYPLCSTCSEFLINASSHWLNYRHIPVSLLRSGV